MIISDEGYAVAMGNIYISSEQIIQEVQKFQCLYDPGHPDHKDRDVMRDAWQSVTAAVVGEPWDCLNSAEKNEAEKDLKKRWRDMRDSLLKSIKGGCFLPPREGIKRRPYFYYKEMSFLFQTEAFKEHLTDDMVVPIALDTVKPERLAEFEKIRFRIVRPKKKVSSSPPQPFNQTVQDDCTFERQDSSASCKTTSTVLRSATVSNLEDPDRMFLLSLLPTMSALNSGDKLDFQIRIMQLLQQYETEEFSS